MPSWDERYAASRNLFGDNPSPLLTEYRHLFTPGMKALALADGEGRNGVWLAQQGLAVSAIDLSAVALERARARAAARGVALQTVCADLLEWDWPQEAFDLVTLIFLHLPAAQKQRLHRLIAAALKPGGHVLLEAFHRDQAGCASGGPTDPDLLYTLEAIEQDFAAFEMLKLARVETDVVLDGKSQGKGFAVHFVARKPGAGL
jgi:SAM-dependent methyltransferase